jgi:hypothetical protein
MYNEGKRSQKDYLRRRLEENLFVGITVAGNVAIWSVCPPAGIVAFAISTTLSALEEYLILPQNEPTAIVIEDIEYVFPKSNTVGMKGGRLVDIEPEFAEALLELAKESFVNYCVSYEY